jgi:hypothetical protein
MQFNWVGKIVPVKDSEKLKGYEEKVYDSKWMSQRLRFNFVAGTNRHLVEINAGKWAVDNKNSVVYTYSKAEEGEKSKPIQIEWGKRNDPDEIAKVAGSRLFTVDTDTYQHRQELEEKKKKALEANDEDSVLEISKEIEDSKKKCRHFIAASDFVEFARKVVYSEKTNDWTFRVRGNVNYNYSENTGKYYATYEVQKIYRVDESVEPTSELNVNFFFAEGAVDSETYDETGKAIVNGWTTFYDSNTKKTWFCPLALALRGDTDEKGKKKLAVWEKVFSKFEDDEIRKINLTCSKIDGAEKCDIKLEDLDEDTQMNIEAGLISLQDAIRDAGGQMFGDRVQEIRIEKLGRGSSKGSETTAYTLDDVNAKPHKEEEDDEVVDLFDDSDDDDI